MDSNARNRARLVLTNVIAMLTALGLAGIGKSLYLTPHGSAAMATGLISLLLGGILFFSFSICVRYLTQGEFDWERLTHNPRSLRLNTVISVGLPLVLVFLGSDGPRLLGAPTVPLYFRLLLGFAMLTMVCCSVLVLQHFVRLTRALKG